MTTELNRLLSLIDFTQEAVLSKTKPINHLHKLKELVLFEEDLKVIESIEAKSDFLNIFDDISLEIPYPELENPIRIPSNKTLLPWVIPSTDPDQEPVLKRKIEGRDLIQAGTHLEKTGFLTSSNSGLPKINPNEHLEFENYESKQDVEKEFNNFINLEWKQWCINERRKIKLSSLYGKFFSLKQNLSGSFNQHQLELVFGSYLIKCKLRDSEFFFPLITKLVDIDFDEKKRRIILKSRHTYPRLDIDNLQVDDTEIFTMLEDEFSKISNTDFSKSPKELNINFVKILKDFSSKIQNIEEITDFDLHDSYVFFARIRNNNLAAQDLERFRYVLKGLNNNNQIPNAIKSIVKEPSEKKINKSYPKYKGISSAYQGSSESQEFYNLFFTKPFNDEQARMAMLLEISDGIAVQGPPGTGKTHTIANIITHWLARGKRVLVTSMRDTALTVLKDMLPAEIKPLAVSILSSKENSIKDLEESIEKIISIIQSLDKVVNDGQINDLEKQIDAVHSRISKIDIDIKRWATLNLLPIKLDGKLIDPQDAASHVSENKGQFEWIPDRLGISQNFDPLFTNNDILELQNIRKRLGNLIIYATDELPDFDKIPTAVKIAEAHETLMQFSKLTKKAKYNDWPWPADSSNKTLELARDLSKKVRSVLGTYGHLIGAKLPWSNQVVMRIKKKEPKQSFLALDSLGPDIEKLSLEKNKFINRPVSIPELGIDDQEIIEAIDNLSNNRKPFKMGGFGKSQIKKILRLIKVSGIRVVKSEDWSHVKDYILWQRSRKELTARWNEIAPDVGMHSILSIDTKGQLSAESQYALYKNLTDLSVKQENLANLASETFPGWSRASLIAIDPLLIDELNNALDYHLTRMKLSEVDELKKNIQEFLEQYKGVFVTELKTFIKEKLGNPEIESTVFMKIWDEKLVSLEGLYKIKKELDLTKNTLEKIHKSGGIETSKGFLKPIAESFSEIDTDQFIKFWNLKRLSVHLHTIESQSELKKLNTKRIDLERDLANAYEMLVTKKTWSHLEKNVTPSVRSSLQSYLNSMQRIGKGMGKRANRYREDARYAALDAQKAIPCWIMSHHKVSETLPSELGSFDLVVIDEASQSDISALPVLLRGKKYLIVGDDKQVAPQNIGLDETKISNLINKYLKDQVNIFRSQFAPDKSVYDLARVVFADDGIMLKEHFRCVSPIIEFSKREFYKHELRPLRLAHESEKIEPPLLDVFVNNGVRENNVNRQEIEFIVNQILKLTKEKSVKIRTIGVVSLLGEDQALRIWDRIIQEISPEDINKHEIVCGDARMFQGREKDIVFLSMVIAPNNIGSALSRDIFAQRFNVACSRARDQMVLVRSVDIEDLHEGDFLRKKLIQHFRKPYDNYEPQKKQGVELCESSLERKIYYFLQKKGYKVTPKVNVGTYPVDFVVEGEHDHRLAIECDGDKYQGVDNWIESVRRQRALERAGWTFWRCFATSFYLHPIYILSDLEKTLKVNGIYPFFSKDTSKNQICETIHVNTKPARLIVA